MSIFLMWKCINQNISISILQILILHHLVLFSAATEKHRVLKKEKRYM